jgi:hypothetical protein
MHSNWRCGKGLTGRRYRTLGGGPWIKKSGLGETASLEIDLWEIIISLGNCAKVRERGLGEKMRHFRTESATANSAAGDVRW